MIIGIGVDIIEIARIENSLEKFGVQFINRILNTHERGLASEFKPQYLAARFAAKEAVFKALGTGLAQGLSFHDAQIDKDISGKPILSLSGQALVVSKQMGVKNIHLSLSHSRENAVAMVILEG